MFEFRDYIGNEYIQGLLQGIVLKGFDPYAVLQQAGIPPQAYDDPNARLDGAQLHNLIMAAKQIANDSYLGFLEFPAKLPMETEVSEKAMQTGTLGEAMEATSRFLENYRTDYTYHFRVDPHTHEYQMGLHYKTREGLDPHFLHFYRLGSVYKFGCWLIGNRIKLTRICFPEDCPDYCFDYEKMFHCEIQFNQPECLLCFDQKYLTAKVIRTSPEILDLGTRYTDWFTIPGQERSLSSQIEHILLELQAASTFNPPIEAIAEILSINPRTIRRMLARENESFQKIKVRVRCDLAIKLLLDSQLPISVVADKVGFAEPGDFTRAFTQWTGQTPKDYRSAHLKSKKHPQNKKIKVETPLRQHAV